MARHQGSIIIMIIIIKAVDHMMCLIVSTTRTHNWQCCCCCCFFCHRCMSISKAILYTYTHTTPTHIREWYIIWFKYFRKIQTFFKWSYVSKANLSAFNSKHSRLLLFLLTAVVAHFVFFCSTFPHIYSFAPKREYYHQKINFAFFE